MSPTVYLISGANRGLGRGMVEALLQRPDVTIIAGVRDTTSSSSKSLTTLPAGPNSKVILTTIDVSSQESIKSGIASLRGITHIDILISNAGISNYYGPATETPLSTVREHFEVNAIGSLSLFQESWPLLKESKKEGGPVFLAISTGVASMTAMEKIPMQATAYGMSKAALNYAVRKIHFENPGLVAFVISPGWVETEMGNFGATSHGMEKAPVTVAQSISGVLGKLDVATREKTGGTFLSFDDDVFAW